MHTVTHARDWPPAYSWHVATVATVTDWDSAAGASWRLPVRTPTKRRNRVLPLPEYPSPESALFRSEAEIAYFPVAPAARCGNAPDQYHQASHRVPATGPQFHAGVAATGILHCRDCVPDDC